MVALELDTAVQRGRAVGGGASHTLPRSLLLLLKSSFVVTFLFVLAISDLLAHKDWKVLLSP